MKVDHVSHLPEHMQKQVAQWWDHENYKNSAREGKPDWRDSYNWLYTNLKREKLQNVKKANPFDDIDYEAIDQEARSEAARIAERAIRTYNYTVKEKEEENGNT